MLETYCRDRYHKGVGGRGGLHSRGGVEDRCECSVEHSNKSDRFYKRVRYNLFDVQKHELRAHRLVQLKHNITRCFAFDKRDALRKKKKTLHCPK